MAVSNATLLAKISALEARVTKLAAKVKSDETANSAKFTTLNPLLTAPNLAFLAGLRQLGNQNNSLPQDGNSGSNWATSERDFINQCIVSLNTLHSHMQDSGFEHP